ncbi:recombinase [Mycolicibacterium elephantis]|uniref:Recombinase n=1 Tax=Mycolicibacterium elephantis TaxID=81858 RepID=A0A1X0D789_9MYCO|nr:recombinase [Mycolicibacterium elephantis]
MKAVIYTRISKDREGAGLGVERQRADCAALADRLGWQVVGTFSDNDLSAYSGRHRPGYAAMCEALEAGEAQAIIAWHTDRLHRRPVELESFIGLCERRSIQVRTVRAGTLDLSTPSGQMVARMLGAAARHEIDHAIERQKRAKKQAALDGRYRGSRRAFGYERDGLTLCDAEADAIRTAAERVLSGTSLSQVARDWNAAGLRTAFGGKAFTSREVRRILLRPRNAGYSLHEGKRIPNAQWPPIITTDTFAALEALLRDPVRSKHLAFERKWMGSGVYLCGKCGAKISTASQKGTGKSWRPTYVCSASKHLGRVADTVDEYVTEAVLERLSRPDAPILLGGNKVDVADLTSRRDGYRARLDELAAMFAAGDIDAGQLKSGTTELRRKLDRVDAELAAARASSVLADLVLSGDDLRDTWAAIPPGGKGKVIDALMTVTIEPTRRGRRPGGSYFDPESVTIRFKGVGEHRLDDGQLIGA